MTSLSLSFSNWSHQKYSALDDQSTDHGIASDKQKLESICVDDNSSVYTIRTAHKLSLLGVLKLALQCFCYYFSIPKVSIA